ncbi:universal stress protein [Polyangium aurulentum]|uniref:universal stress protein n=1 Tax=Polyangium aurulentum TaxID=2567896 RepID=UPI0010AE0F0F|nr:universal stress protein [Polyangium aurulentum]UQA58965.1 universal stress protein [Polyangium aurulentum]
MGPYHHILAPTDFSEPSRHALDVAADLALVFGAKLTLMHAFEVPGYGYAGINYGPIDLVTPMQDAAKELLSKELEATRKKVPGAEAVLRLGLPWDKVIAVATEISADLIVMGTHGRSGIKRALLGSVAEKVVRHSPLPVLTIRTAERSG